MIIKALLVALIYYLACWGHSAFGIFHLNRPIIIGTLIGLVLGDLKTGIILGGTFESVFLGVIAVGGAVPADASIGAALGTAIGILTGVNTDTALAVAVPSAMLGVIVMGLTTSVIMPLFVPKIDALAEKGDRDAVNRMHWFLSLIKYLLQAIAIFFAVWLGTNAINSVLNQIPEFVLHGFKAAGAMLPVVGLGLLLNMLFNKKVFPFYFLGFALCIYLKLPSLAIAIIAVVFAISQYFNMQNKPVQAVADAAASSNVIVDNDDEDEEDFFDE